MISFFRSFYIPTRSPSAFQHPEYLEQWFCALELLLTASELLYKPLGLLGKPIGIKEITLQV